MKVKCTTGHIGLGGVIYSTGDVFDVEDEVVVKSLVDGGDAEAVIDATINEPDGVVDKSETPDPAKPRTRGRKVTKQ